MKSKTVRQSTAESPNRSSQKVSSLEPFAKELVRLARDVTQEIDRGRLTPRCLSGLTAMKPLIGLIQDTALKILRTTAEAESSGDNGDHDDDDNVEVAPDDESSADDEGSGLTPGYL